MKLGVTHYPPLSFRALSMWLGLPALWLVLRVQGVPFAVARSGWRELGALTFFNMLVWHVLAILAVQALSSGRAAILGYTMPIFSALLGAALFGERIHWRQAVGVAAAALGVVLLLWHEIGAMAGRPWAVLAMLVAAAAWAYGTQRMRRTRLPEPTLALVFWMTLATAIVMTVVAALRESSQWHAPDATAWAAIVYNALLIFAFAQPVWLWLARTLPPIASTLSVMMIPVLGVISGAWWLGETLHWQDWTAVALIMVAIASVLLPQRRSA
ncbi:DMT family transporter [Caldimonas sp. KR1-144]|uniref:DMT family transporter n=1 Tax=Caldimonas sp. KR1-144 TaxID=3400911 RepID=UPI003C12695C